MNMPQIPFSRAQLRDIIAKKVDADRGHTIIGTGGRRAAWTFDLKTLLMDAAFLRGVSLHMWEQLKSHTPLQIGGLESAAMPLVSALSLLALESGSSVKSFYIRKTRKTTEFQRRIEGELDSSPVVIVDDVLSSGTSVMEQIDVLEKEGKRVYAVFAIVRYHDLGFYRHITERGVRVVSLFTLEDFPGVEYVLPEPPPPMPFTVVWKFVDAEANFFHVIPKSAPVIDDAKIYFGADDGYFRALSQEDGHVVWQHKITLGAEGKYIFSSAALYDGVIYYGAYDGTVYALRSLDGAVLWTYSDSEWVASSPAVAGDRGLVFIGIEQGLHGRHGALVALDLTTGEKRWWSEMPSFASSSPLYVSDLGLVVFGSNDGMVRGYDAVTGRVLWSYLAHGAIKASFAYAQDREMIAFGSMDGTLHLLDARTGKRHCTVSFDAGIHSTPVIYDDVLYIGCLDRSVYCIELEGGRLRWKFQTNGRVFASPVLYQGELYIGSNDAWLYLLDAGTGALKGLAHGTERVVNKVAINDVTGRIFVPTHACEIMCLTRSKVPKLP